MSSKGKGILGFSPNFPAKEHLVVSPMPDLGHSGVSSRGGSLETVNTSFRVDCPHFDGGNFRGWWSKLEQYFEAKGLGSYVTSRGKYIRLASLFYAQTWRVALVVLGGIC